MTLFRTSSLGSRMILPILLVSSAVVGAHAAPLASVPDVEESQPFLFPPEPPLPAQSPLKPEHYPIPRVPPYTPRPIVADQWAYPTKGFAVDNVLTDVTERCLIEQSTDGISGWIPKNLRCARSVSYLLRQAVPAFRGHDRAETCAQRIRKNFAAKRTRTYNLQDQLDNVPEGYLYVICLLHSSKSRVGHIAFYDPDTKGVLGNSMGKWKEQPLEKYWSKYKAYYLLGIPRANVAAVVQH